MRFTPTAFMGSGIGGQLIATAIGATSGSFTSGSTNYGYIKFETGSFNLNIAGEKGIHDTFWKRWLKFRLNASGCEIIGNFTEIERKRNEHE
jgi:hypothetical protein